MRTASFTLFLLFFFLTRILSVKSFAQDYQDAYNSQDYDQTTPDYDGQYQSQEDRVWNPHTDSVSADDQNYDQADEQDYDSSYEDERLANDNPADYLENPNDNYGEDAAYEDDYPREQEMYANNSDGNYDGADYQGEANPPAPEDRPLDDYYESSDRSLIPDLSDATFN